MSPVKSPEHKIVDKKDEAEEHISRSEMSPVQLPEDKIVDDKDDAEEHISCSEMSPVKLPEDEIVDEKDEAEGLPPGWRIEVKRRKSGSEKKVDRFYTDPVTGYIFRSLRDAQRYLKTGQLGRHAIKPKNRDCVATDTKDEKLHTKREELSKSKQQTSETSRHKRALTDKLEPAKCASKGEKRDELSKSKQQTSETSRRKRALTDKPELAKCSSKREKREESSKLKQQTSEASRHRPALTDKPELAKRASKRVARVTVDFIDALSPQEPKTCQATRLAGVPVDAPSPPQPNTRRATRQAKIKINPTPPSSPDNSTSHQATQPEAVNSVTPKVNDKKTDARLVTPKAQNKEIEMRPATSPPAVIPPASLGKQESPMVNPTISNPIPQNSHVSGSEKKPDPSVNFSMDDLWTDPCIEFAVKTLTGAIPFGDLNKVENFSTTTPLQVPLAELWTDPCIEFAVKTLTGAIPVGEDDHLRYNQPESSANPQSPRGFSLPDLGSFSSQQQNLQNSGKFVTGSNGQGSRSRLIQ